MHPQSNENLQSIIELLNKANLAPNSIKARRKALFEQPKLITIIGGTGFIGKAIAKKLCTLGYRVAIVARNTRRAYELMQFGDVGQVQCISANILRRSIIASLIQDSAAVIFAANGSSSTGANSYHKVNVEGAKFVAEIAQKLGIGFIYFSSLQQAECNANAQAIAKSFGEDAVRHAHSKPVILRPSLVFGFGDKIFTHMANLARFSPSLPVFGNRDIRLQPIYVGDIANFTAWLLESDLLNNIIDAACFELGGPEKLTQEEIIQTLLTTIKRQRRIKHLTRQSSTILSALLGLTQKLPFSANLLTKADVHALSMPSMVSAEAKKEGRILQAAQIEQHSLAAIAPSYLWHLRPYGQFEEGTTPDWAR